MKKVSFFFCILFVIPLLFSAAHADVIWEPNNNFYNRHRNECTYLNRSFYANGQDGYVNFHNAPNGMVTDHFENGTVLHIDWQYQNWGTVSLRVNDTWKEGWVCLDDCILKYDHISFTEEYGDQIKRYSGEFSDFDQKIPCINFYAYPGAPEIQMTKDLKDNTSLNQDFMNALTDTTQSAISSVFTDESGLTWGYIGYWRGYRNIWFCMDDPAGDNFPVRNAVPGLIPPHTPPSAILSGYLPYLLIGAVVVVTASLLVVMGVRSKKSKKGSSEH